MFFFHLFELDLIKVTSKCLLKQFINRFEKLGTYIIVVIMWNLKNAIIFKIVCHQVEM